MAGQGFDSPNQSQWGDQDNRWQNYLPWGASADKYNGAKPDENNNGIPAQNSGWYNWASAGAQRTSNSANLRGGDFVNWYGAGVIGAEPVTDAGGLGQAGARAGHRRQAQVLAGQRQFGAVGRGNHGA